MNPNINSNDLLKCAIKAAQTAGTHALENKHRRHETIEVHAHDVKLKLDVECQLKAEEIIRSTYPDHTILGEEQTSSPATNNQQPTTSSYRWIIDPIDGTVNFSHGLPVWCCSIAVQYDKKTIAGAIYAPEPNELYTATIDTPALCNEQEITVSRTGKLSDSIVLTGMDKKLDPNLKSYELFSRIATNAQKARIMGSAALDLCQVAKGNADGYFETGLYLWDIAAADLIVRQAGGQTEVIGEIEEDYGLIFLASNGSFQDELKNLVKIDNKKAGH